MSQRGLGFKQLEDEILCNAYVHHSTDSEIGTYQSKDDLWAKIESYYNHEVVDVNNFERRNTRSLCARFDKIASSCTLFRASLIQVKARNQSGGNAESMLAEAKELYIIKEPKNQPFKFDHAWKILKFHVKWAEPIQPNTSSPLRDTSSPFEEGTSSPLGHGGSEKRPIGMKAAKAKRRLTKEKDPMWQEMMDSVGRSQDLMQKQHEEYLNIQNKREARANLLASLKQKKSDMKEKKLKLKADEKDMEVMRMDLSKLTPFSKNFWSNKKQAIVDRGSMSRAARNLNFSEGSDEDVYVPESPSNNNNNNRECNYGKPTGDDNFLTMTVKTIK